MSDATLGLLVIAVPVAGVALLLPPTRRLIHNVVRLIGFTLAVLGIGLVGGEPKRMLMASLVRHGTDSDKPGRHAAAAHDDTPEPEYLDTAPDDVPAPIPARPGVEPYSPEWYEVVYD